MSADLDRLLIACHLDPATWRPLADDMAAALGRKEETVVQDIAFSLVRLRRLELRYGVRCTEAVRQVLAEAFSGRRDDPSTKGGGASGSKDLP